MCRLLKVRHPRPGPLEGAGSVRLLIVEVVVREEVLAVPAASAAGGGGGVVGGRRGGGGGGTAEQAGAVPPAGTGGGELGVIFNCIHVQTTTTLSIRQQQTSTNRPSLFETIPLMPKRSLCTSK